MAIKIENIPKIIENISEISDDDLVYLYKICSSKSTAKDKKVFGPLQKVIEKQRRKNGDSSTITSKPVATKVNTLGANPDDY